MRNSLLIIVLVLLCTLVSCTFDSTGTEGNSVSDTSNADAENKINQTDIEETEYFDISNYYLSITGSYSTDDGILSEVYATFDFSTGTLDKVFSVPATSSYPCGVCDLKNDVVYYAAAEETIMNDRVVYLNNVYAYHIDNGSIEKITKDGCYMNRMIPVGDRIYFAGGMLSSISVDFGWIELEDNVIVIPNKYDDIKGINVRNIEYSYVDEEMYLGWYSLTEQNKLDKEFYERQESKDKNNVRELTEYYLDKVNVKTLEINTLECFKDFHVETFTISQTGNKIMMYGLDEDSYRIRENGVTSKYDYPASGLTVMSPDGNAIYYINTLPTEKNGVPNTIMRRYDFYTEEITDIFEFDFYINNMVLLFNK